MVSAAKLKRAQDNITKLRPYSEKLEQILGNISAGLSESDNNAYTQKRELKKVLLIAISSNRGLCGAFNTNITKKVIELKETKYKGIAVDMVEIGKKAGDALRYRGYSSVASYNDIYDDLTFDAVSEIASTYMNAFVAGEYDAIELVYNQFKNAATQIIQAEPFLPVVVESKEDLVEMNYIFEPNQENIVNDLIPKALKLQLFKSVLDSNASEHGARMTAMHKATDNASDLISDLQLTYNKARQASITNEILEIVGGAEALKG
jgi:F-type H+-transporting ATPase subunit gamma